MASSRKDTSRVVMVIERLEAGRYVLRAIIEKLRRSIARKICGDHHRLYDDCPNIGARRSRSVIETLVHLTGKTLVRKAAARGTRNKSSVRSPRALHTTHHTRRHVHAHATRTRPTRPHTEAHTVAHRYYFARVQSGPR